MHSRLSKRQASYFLESALHMHLHHVLPLPPSGNETNERPQDLNCLTTCIGDRILPHSSCLLVGLTGLVSSEVEAGPTNDVPSALWNVEGYNRPNRSAK